MIRAVIDTNVIISGVIRPSSRSRAGRVLELFRAGQFELVYSQALLEELVDALARPKLVNKYGITREHVELLLDVIAEMGVYVAPGRHVRVCRDPDDDKVIEAALAGDAACVVTGDHDLLDLGVFETVRFVSLRDFIERFE